MTPRERELATIRRQPTDRIAVDVICIENVPEVAEYLGIPEADVHDRLGIDGRILAAAYVPGTDPWETAASGDYGTQHSYSLADAESAADVGRFPWPDAAGFDYAGAAQIAREVGRTYAVRGPYWMPLFCRVCSLMGMEEAMVKMHAQLDVFEAALDRVFEFTYAYCERLLDACGEDVPILCLGDDFATQRGLMISPESWRRFLKPRYARLFEIGKKRGKHVWFHSCGDITSVLPDLIEIGMDVWETVQLHTLPMSPANLKREFGRDVTFFGAINTQRLPFAKPHEIREEVLRVIDVLGAGGGYICGPDHHIKPDVPPENVVALFDAAKGI